MTELVVYVFTIISLAMGGGDVAVSQTEKDCEEVRAATIAIVEEKAPQIGDAVYVGPCQRIVLKSYGKKA
jgi:hypothetical protein